jgi:uncharacterized protein YciI
MRSWGHDLRSFSGLMGRFAVTRAPGPNWDPAKPTREQAGWDPHAVFMDALHDEGFIAYGGPAGTENEVVLVVEAPDETTIRARFDLDPWTEAGLLRIAAIEPWTIWLGGDEHLDPTRGLYLVAYAPGPDWDDSKSRREQDGWDAHAQFMDDLADQRVVAVGGPLDERRALLVMQHQDERALRALIDRDPWADGVLRIERVERWALWLAPRARSAGFPAS